MSEAKKKCKYINDFTDWECPYEALEDSKDGFCIFHERRKDKDVKKFNEGIKKILEDEDSDAYHFDGFFFPSSIDFSKFEFKKDVFFAGAEFLGKNTKFWRSKFAAKNTDFREAKFSEGRANFIGAEFSGENAIFVLTKFSVDTDFIGAEFSAGNTNFSWAEFSRGNVNFEEAKFLGKNTSFWEARFSGKKASFADTKFLKGSINFNGTKFSAEYTDFSCAEFSGEDIDHYYTEFLKTILYVKTIFKAKINFTGVNLRKCVFAEVDLKNVDFSLLQWDWKYKLKNETKLEELLDELDEKEDKFYFKTSEIYRQLKVQFHTKRDFAKAGMFHFREQECKRSSYKLPRDFFKWIFLWILKLSCGYGEKLGNVGLTSIALIFLFAFCYMFLGLHNADDSASLVFNYDLSLKNIPSIITILRNLGTSLIFSIKGFFPLWRFQQYEVVGDFANLVAGIEFLLGAFMVGLFVYVFRRRMDK